MKTLRGHRSRAVLMRGHGTFTIGRDARDAVKAAAMVEDVARAVFIARQLGTPTTLAQAEIDACSTGTRTCSAKRDPSIAAEPCYHPVNTVVALEEPAKMVCVSRCLSRRLVPDL